MRVRLLTTMMGPDISHSAGDVVDFDESRARELIAGGYAIAVNPDGSPIGESHGAPSTEAETTDLTRRRGQSR